MKPGLMAGLCMGLGSMTAVALLIVAAYSTLWLLRWGFARFGTHAVMIVLVLAVFFISGFVFGLKEGL